MQGNQRRWLALLALGVLALSMLACGGFQLRGTTSVTATPRATRALPTVEAATRPVATAAAEAAEPTDTPEPSPTPEPAGSVLGPGKAARITTTVNVRSEARSSAQKVGTFAANDTVTVRDGPANADNYSWYQVDNGKGLVGWVASGPANSPWLVPAEGGAAAPAPTAASGPRLVNRSPNKGDLVQVTTQTGQVLTVRAEPGKSAETVAKAMPGTQFKVIDGPQDKDGFIWWQIEGSQYKGWAAEGDSETRWLTPVE